MCQAWNTAVPAISGVERTITVPDVVFLSSDLGGSSKVHPSIPEFDRLLSGGVPEGATLLLAGEPGIGKSTLVLQVLVEATKRGARVLYLSGEEPLGQIAARARRVGDPDGCPAATVLGLEEALALIKDQAPDLVVVDSLQALCSNNAGPAALREAASALVEAARRTGSALIVVGHVTKDGDIAGPKSVEHVVDVVMTLEGERSGTLRLLRLSKNRFGPCDETGVFTLEASGLIAVKDPSALLLADRNPEVTGSCVFPAIEGSRSLMIEIQALLGPASGQPRRVASGLQPRRLALLLAVLARRARIKTADLDVFVSAVGGVAVREPAADLAICLALASSLNDVVVPSSLVVVGEVGLGGEVRSVPGTKRRLTEAGRLGFTHAVVPVTAEVPDDGPTPLRVPDVRAAVALLHEL